MLFLFRNELVISLHKLGNRHPLHPYKDFAARVNLTISHQRLPSSYCLTHKIAHFIFRTLENWLFHANPGICRFRWKNLLCVWQQAQSCRQVAGEHQILRKMHRKVSNYRVSYCQGSSFYLFEERVVVLVGVGRTFWTGWFMPCWSEHSTRFPWIVWNPYFELSHSQNWGGHIVVELGLSMVRQDDVMNDGRKI